MSLQLIEYPGLIDRLRMIVVVDNESDGVPRERVATASTKHRRGLSMGPAGKKNKNLRSPRETLRRGSSCEGWLLQVRELVLKLPHFPTIAPAGVPGGCA